MPENQTTQPGAAGNDRPWGEKKREQDKVALETQYRQIGIPAVAAAAGSRRQPRKDGDR